MVAFCPWTKYLPEAKLKIYGLTAMTEEIFSQLLTVLLTDGHTMQIYNEKEQLRKKNYKMKSLRKKGAPGNVTKLNPVFKEIKRL